MAIKIDSPTQKFEQSTEQMRELTERSAVESRKASLSAVEAYEKTGWGYAELQARVAKTSQVDWLTSLLEAQADFTRTVVSAQASAARSVLS